MLWRYIFPPAPVVPPMAGSRWVLILACPPESEVAVAKADESGEWFLVYLIGKTNYMNKYFIQLYIDFIKNICFTIFAFKYKNNV